MKRSPARPRTLHSFSYTAYVVVALIPPTILIAFLIGSLIFSGGQVSEKTDAMWGVVRPYPLFPVPTVVLVSLATVAAALAIVVAFTARAGDATALRGLMGPTVAGIVAAVLFSALVPDGSTRSGDLIFGGQWIAGVIHAAAVVILLLGVAKAMAAAKAEEALSMRSSA